MTTELIAAILKLASAQEAIATQLGRIADQITPTDDPMKHAPTGVDLVASAIDNAALTAGNALDELSGAIKERN